MRFPIVPTCWSFFGGPTLLLWGLLTATVANAQPVPSRDAPSEDDAPPDIIVYGERLRLIRNLPPTMVLTRDQLDRLNASTAGELAAKSREMMQSGGGQPITLLNGRRVASPDDFADLPAQAIERIENWPPPAGAKFGYGADQSVTNFVTQKRFTGGNLDQVLRHASEGRGASQRSQANFAKIANERRVSLSGDLEHQSWLKERDRLDQFEMSAADHGEPATVRTLLPAELRLRVSGTYAMPVGKRMNGLATLALDRRLARSLEGLLNEDEADAGQAFGRLVRRTRGSKIRLGAKLDGYLGASQLTLTASAEQIQNDTDGISALDERDATSRAFTGFASSALATPLFELPAGTLDANVTLSATAERLKSTGFDGSSSDPLRRSIVLGRLALTIPLTSKPRNVFGAIGSLSAGLTADISSISGRNWVGRGASLTWVPFPSLIVTVGASRSFIPPELSLLGDSEYRALNLPIFDYVKGSTYFVTATYQGNSSLEPEQNRSRRITAIIRPWPQKNLQITAEYSSQVRRERPFRVTALTRDTLDALPQLVTRDADGNPIAILVRPFGLYRDRQREMRTELSYFGPLGSPPKDGADDRPFLMWTMKVNRLLERKVVIARGSRSIDLLHGDALETVPLPRSTLQSVLNIAKGPVGVTLVGTWRSSASVKTDDSGTLRFGSLATVDVDAFVDLSTLAKGSKLFQNLKLTARVQNLFNKRQDVRDEQGLNPRAFSPAYLDPLGRLLSVALRKSF